MDLPVCRIKVGNQSGQARGPAPTVLRMGLRGDSEERP